MIYLDACALIKLLIPEPESVALADYLAVVPEPLVTSELSTVELHRALTRLEAGDELHDAADAVLGDLLRLPLGPAVSSAARLPGRHLRSLDALHLATARELAGPLTELITYDKRLAEHAAAAGVTVTAPS
ncbi:MAG: type II toxin-antitoxin system VapC family toxin [Micromonosporaceae bacterium]